MGKLGSRYLDEIKDLIDAESEDMKREIATIISSIIEFHVDTLEVDSKKKEELEDYIVNACLNCKYVRGANINKVESYKYKEGAFEASLKIENGNLIGVDKKITMPSTYQIENAYYQKMMIKEILKMIRNENGFRLTRTRLQKRNGLEKTNYKYDEHGEIVTTSHMGYGLENGSIEYITNKILSSITNNMPDVKENYDRLIAGELMDADGINLGRELLNASITGDATMLTTTINACGIDYDELVKITDKYSDLEASKLRAVDDDELYKKIDDTMNKYLEEKIVPMICTIKKNKMRESGKVI